MTIWLWVGFLTLVMGLLAVDLGLLNRKAHVFSTREALAWTAFWIILALIFNIGVYQLYEKNILGVGTTVGHQLTGKEAALRFLTGYLVEKSLSLDNIFVIAMIFAYFHVPAQFQHRVLFWGILGALILRGVMIGAGAALIHRFEWIIYVFGALLVLTALKMLMQKEERIEPDRNPLVRLARRFYPVTAEFEGQKFFTRMNGRRAVTPLFLVLLVVESTDVLFAIDSIPAIFGITSDPFLVFTSNVFAILGLRSLYFVLASIIEKFRYLKLSIVVVLAYIGVKMLISAYYKIDPLVSLAVVCGVLAVGMTASIIVARRLGEPIFGPAMTDEFGEMARMTLRQVRRALILVVGASVVLVGLAMIVLPGPATVVIPAGIAILATEFVWARRLLKKMKEKGLQLAEAVTGRSRPPSGEQNSPDARK